MEKTDTIKRKITYEKLFWLFIFGGIIGVVMEGIFCLISTGHWESHVVTLVGQFNVLYGVGAVLFYSIIALLYNKKTITKVLAITIIATVLELLCGILLADVLGMKAWDYSNCFMNYRGMICLVFTLGWGFAGYLFCLLFDKIDNALSKIKSKKWKIACIALSVFMAVNLLLTAISIVRWSERHYGIEADTKIGAFFDESTPDDWMQKRFIEWSFLDKQGD